MTTDWIKIEPGCRMPLDKTWVPAMVGDQWVKAFYHKGRFQNLGEAQVFPTHWMPIVPPAPEPDACARWLDCERVTDPMCRNWARAGWNAALEHARRDNARMP